MAYGFQRTDVSASEHKASISWVLGIIVAFGAVLATWDRLGWVTIPAYAQDHEGASVEVQQQTIITSLNTLNKALGALQEGQDRNQDQWECDETDEELQDLADKEDTTGLSSKEKRTRKKLEEVWTNKRCTRFTD